MSNFKIWIIITIIITLILGFILGLLADRYSFISCRYARKSWASKEILQERLLARLSRKLDLSRPQIQAIGGILRMQAVRINELNTQLKQIRKDTMDKIMPHLTPEQQEKYKKLVKLQRERWEKVCPGKRYSQY